MAFSYLRHQRSAGGFSGKVRPAGAIAPFCRQRVACWLSGANGLSVSRAFCFTPASTRVAAAGLASRARDGMKDSPRYSGHMTDKQ
ncbi:hypothetical protein KCP73_23470 [Salmonella enterica subsp. enterica]|nr:hypothetical protein KCP73_23470 [Salmonella enterica subsp. enterica]